LPLLSVQRYSFFSVDASLRCAAAGPANSGSAITMARASAGERRAGRAEVAMSRHPSIEP
jgi:hypothetical protein